MMRTKSVSAILVLILIVFFVCGCGGTVRSARDVENADSGKIAGNAGEEDECPVVALAWSNKQDSYTYQSIIAAVEDAGGTPFVLDMVKSYDLDYDDNDKLVNAADELGVLTPEAAKLVKNNTWQNSNVEEVMDGINCVIIPGGWDFSPTLYYNEQKPHGIERDSAYCAERDVSDYILLSYCLEMDIPMFAICRGMQMLSVVSGAEMAQDIPTWFEEMGVEYHYEHRDQNVKAFTAHPVDVISEDSLLYRVTGKNILEKVPSWHHQVVSSVEGTRLAVTGIDITDGITIIEAVERRDKTFCLGVQFHPEVAVRKSVEQSADASDYMDYESAISFFKAIIEAGQEYAEGLDNAA